MVLGAATRQGFAASSADASGFLDFGRREISSRFAGKLEIDLQRRFPAEDASQEKMHFERGHTLARNQPSHGYC
jgi:hypothetical protein